MAESASFRFPHFVSADRKNRQDTAVRCAYSECVKINWGRACAGALIAEITQIAAAFGWVAIYSYLINPGQPMATYQAHAQASGPWVSILAGAPPTQLTRRSSHGLLNCRSTN